MNQTNNSINLIQLTDLHLYAEASGILKGINTRVSFEKVLTTALQTHQANVLLLTGDLADKAESGAYQYLSQRMSTMSIPSFYLAGNHDGSSMHDIFAQGNLRLLNSLIMENWRLIGLNSCIVDQVTGYLSDAVLTQLQHDLDQSQDYHVGILLHHHVLSVGGHMDSLGLQNSQALIDLLESYEQVKFVLSGHAHQDFSQQQVGCQWLVTPSTCYQIDNACQASAYRQLTLMPDGQLETQVIYVE